MNKFRRTVNELNEKHPGRPSSSENTSEQIVTRNLISLLVALSHIFHLTNHVLPPMFYLQLSRTNGCFFLLKVSLQTPVKESNMCFLGIG